jgi:ABC-type sugar transport system permease subunit
MAAKSPSGPAIAVRGARLRRGRLGGTQRRFVWSVLIPCIAFYVIFRFYPFANALNISFREYNIVAADKPFVGFDNYVKIFGNNIFRTSITNSFYYGIVTTIVGLLTSLTVALLIDSLPRVKDVFRAVFFLPQITNAIAVAMVWGWLYQPVYGFFNQVLKAVGLPIIGWLTSPKYAMPSLMLVGVWGGIGMSVVVLMAGLAGIPSVYREACMIDGGNRWHVFWHIRLPLLQPTLAFILVTGFMGAFEVFSSVFVLTQGGPLNRTYVLAYYIYRRAFVDLKMGEASAAAFVMFLLVLIITVFQLRVLRTRWDY